MHKPNSQINPSEISDFILSWLNGNINEEEIKALSGSDWALIDETARRKAITGFLFYKFKEQNSLGFLPQTIQDTWQQHFYNNLKRNEIILRELFKVLNQLQSLNVEAILLKGASLLVGVYQNFGLRPMADADILIKKSDIFHVVQILKEMGFHLQSPKSESLIGKFDAELEFLIDNFNLEVLTGLFQYERFKGILWNKQNDIWENSQSINFEGEAVRILSCQDQVLHWCQHICIDHLLNDLIHFLDIRALIELHKSSLNWSKLLSEARQQNLRTCLYYTLFFTAKFFCLEIPDWVIEELRPVWLKRTFVNLIINKNYLFNPNNSRGIKRYVLQSLFTDKSLDSFKVALKGFFPSREWFLYRYGEKALRKIYLYRIMQPLKILFG